MKLIVGLGNPGKEYENTRHNCGFKVIEKIEDMLQVSCNQAKFKGLYTKTKYKGEDIILLKPQTYMNLSGESIIEAMRFFKIERDDLIVIYDDLDTVVGRIRCRQQGSPGGHNGLKNIIAHIKSTEFKRIRVGIGRDPKIKIIDYVLMKIPTVDQKAMDEAFDMAAHAALLAVEKGFDVAMNAYN